jgi:hypothetical protein
MFAERCRDLVVDSDYQVLHPSPVREQRSLFELSGGVMGEFLCRNRRTSLPSRR